jgi:hypothetical protein
MAARNLLLHLPHQPGFACLSRRPDGEVMPALSWDADQLLDPLLDQFFALDTEMIPAIHRAIGVKPSHLAPPENIQKPDFSASNKHCQANIHSNFGKFNSTNTKNLVSWLCFDSVYGVTLR